MARLDYESFKAYCLKNVAKVMGEDDYIVESIVIRISDEEEHDSIQVVKRDQTSGALHSFRVRPFYLDYYDGMPLGTVLYNIVKLMEDNVDKQLNVDPDFFMNYDKSKDSLIIRPINFKRFKNLLNDCVYELREGIALVLYYMIENTEEGMNSAKVSRKIAEEWLLDEKFLIQTALENTYRMFPPFIVPCDLMIFGEEAAQKVPDNNRFFMNPLMPFSLLPSRLNCYYLCIQNGINGAIAVFYPGVMDSLCAIFKDDLYITLNSIRDAIIHPASTISKEGIRGIARGGSSNIGIGKEDFLSDSAYVYTRAERKLRLL